MFEEFTQMDGSISRRYGGSGLGLAICRRLVGLMGGEITVVTGEGTGSCFRFDAVLERTQAQPEDAQALPAPDSPSLPADKLHVLLVEDNQINQLVARHILERLGHGVSIANNGLEALAALDRDRYDLVLMDAMMPEMDGLAATRHIRAGEDPADRLPIVGLTAGSRTEDLDNCIEAGMDGVTTKPVTIERLRAAITDGLARNRAARTDAAIVATDTQGHVPEPPIPPDERSPKGLSGRWAELVDELGPDAADQIGRAFIEDATARLASLREAARRGDHQTLRQVAHAVAGMGRNVGADGLAAGASALEHGAEKLTEAELGRALAALDAELDHAAAGIMAGLVPV
jgi:CheY-like chemotaxis protein/HPt (histidine-containing phosphotransfer) domain-containing protein